jgi:catechol 2,3-dioxygenase-like lactoylglutathione lyase family enzyme
MKLTDVCIMTHHFDRLVAFYRELLGVEPVIDGDHASLTLGEANLAIWCYASLESMAPGSTDSNTGSGSVYIEFNVADLDGEYQRLLAWGARIDKIPTTFPWGARAMWFRDPDGNRISFYTPAAG